MLLVLQELGQAQERAQAAEARAAAAEQAAQALQQQLQAATARDTAAHSNGAGQQHSSLNGSSAHGNGDGQTGKAAGNGPVIIDIGGSAHVGSNGVADSGAQQAWGVGPNQGAEELRAEAVELRSKLSAADKRVAAASAVQVRPCAPSRNLFPYSCCTR